MDKVDLTYQFAQRLRDAMLQAGLNSARSPSGVNVQKLAEISGHSTQICRKYLKGDVIPEPTKLMTIAKALKVSPGWLLFGEQDAQITPENHLCISKKLLHYLLNQSQAMYNDFAGNQAFADFLMEVVIDISQINANEAQSKKIIDLALSSVRRFSAQR